MYATANLGNQISTFSARDFTERLELFSKINQVFDLRCEIYLWHALSVCLLVADLLVCNKLLKMVDEFLGSLSGLFQDIGKETGRRRRERRNGCTHVRWIPA